ncbi:MAG: DUF885 domain-containing protein [Alphaproteobacteria bacterium]
MRPFWKWFLAVLAAVVLVAGYAGYRTVWGKPFSFNMLLDRQAAFFLLENPQTLTGLGLVDGTWLDFHSGKLDEYSLEKRERDNDRLRGYVAEIKEWDRDRLDPQEQLSYDIALYFYETQLGYEKFDWLGANGDLYPTNQFFGIHTGLPDFLSFSHVVRNAKTARNYVERMRAIGAVIDNANADVARQASLGIVPPDFSIDKTIEQINNFLAPKPEEHPLVTGLAEKMAKLEDLDAEEKDELKADAAAALRDSVYPAYRRLLEREKELRTKATHQAGVWRLPNGAEYYAARLRDNTTTDMTADEIHDYGLSEVTRITTEMDALLKSEGLTEGTVGERVNKLNSHPRYAYKNTEEDRQRLLQQYRDDIARATKAAPQYFAKLPKAPMEVRAVPKYAEQGAAGAYYNAPALDGTRPGIVFVNLRDVSENPSWANTTTAFHEGIPGHHFQIALAQEIEGLPLLRRVATPSAFAEGWALYSERLSKEMGMYERNPFGDLGRLRDELFRAVRLVVDTGMHTKRWTREQAIDYMMKTTGMGEKDVTAEIERYVVWPGQACAYKIGMKQIMDLRARAEAELGSKFDLREFHSVVLLNGGMPLGVLEQSVSRWIAEQKAT